MGDLRVRFGAWLERIARVALPHDNAGAHHDNPFHLMATVATSAGVRTNRFDRIMPEM
jgi:hypothetical protein